MPLAEEEWELASGGVKSSTSIDIGAESSRGDELMEEEEEEESQLKNFKSTRTERTPRWSVLLTIDKKFWRYVFPSKSMQMKKILWKRFIGMKILQLTTGTCTSGQFPSIKVLQLQKFRDKLIGTYNNRP